MPGPGKIAVLALVGALALAGCNQASQTFNFVSSASVNTQYAGAAVNAFRAIDTLATGYLQLPLCPSPVPAGELCRTKAAADVIVPALRTGYKAAKQVSLAVNAAAANGQSSIPVASYNTLAGVITTLQGLYAAYNIHQ